MTHGRMPRLRLLTVAVSTALAASACASDQAAAAPDTVEIVASTEAWRTVAEAVGGDAARTVSVVPPGADPHEYEASPGDALTVDGADVLLINGGGYDDWVRGLAGDGGTVIDAYDLPDPHGAGAPRGGDDNEHVWFDPDTVGAVAHALADALSKADPEHAQGYRDRAEALAGDLARLDRDAAAIAAARPAPVLATEPVAHYLLARAGVRDLTPAGFGEAIEHGSDPAPADLARMRSLLAGHEAAALVYNTQADGPAARAARRDAEAAGVPVVPVAETPPGGVGYVAWVEGILADLRAAVAP